MKVVFLGTNGWYTTETGNTPCVLIDSEKNYVVFDAGNGFYKLDKHITEDKPISLFVSHFHIDHVSGFHSFPKFNFSQGIDVYLPKGRKKDFDTLVNPPFTIGYQYSEANINNLKTKVRVHELDVGKHSIGFDLEIIKLDHAYIGHGYRVQLEEKTIAYSGDTGIGENSQKFAQNADLLIHECSKIVSDPGDKWGHTDPVQTATLAKEASVKQLVLNHFQADLYTTLEKRKEAEAKARAIFPSTIAATDDLVIEL